MFYQEDMYVFTKITVKRIILFPVITLVSLNLAAQDTTTINAGSDTTIVSTVAKAGSKLSGQIKDASTGKPLSGVSVRSGNYSASITNESGSFTLSVPSYTGVVTVSAPGYQTTDIALRGRTTLTVSLNGDDLNSVHDLAVLPFGSKPKTQTPYAVSSINTTGNWERSAETPDNYLQGQVSGLNVIRRSGTNGIGADLFLRGFSSLSTRNQPLIVVDGMIYDTNDYGTSLIGGHVVNPLSNIDLKDIDNITVIKDGGSLYGTKGANGIILISTARAKQLATHIDFAAYGGINSSPGNLPVLGVNDYRLYLSDVLQSAGMTNSQIQSQPYMNDTSNPEYHRYHYNTNWQNNVLGDSYSQNYFLKITGGDNIARYALSMGYLNNNGTIDNTVLNRYNTNFNADLNLSSKLTATTNLSFTNIEQQLKDQGRSFSTNPILLGLTKSPFLPGKQIADDGTESPNLADTDIFGRSNPFAVIENAQQSNKSYRFFGSTKFNYAISKIVSVSSLIGITYDKVRENSFMPRLGITPDTLGNAVAYSRLGSRVQRLFSLYNDTYLSYNKTFSGEHALSANLGLRFNNTDSEEDAALGFNSPTDDFVTVGTGVNALRSIGGDIGKSRWLNTYLNVDYAFNSKYLLSVNLAADGSSRFGSDIDEALTINGNKFAFLPSVAAGWLISSENFMASASNIDLLKLRASYSLSGNDDIGNYSARQYYVSQNLLGNQGIKRGNIANPSLKWETVKTANLGVDLALFNERINLSFDTYSRNTSDMLTALPLSTAVGFDYMLANNGSMKTNGYELGINSRVLNRNLKLDLGLNLGSYSNELTALPQNGQITEFGGATFISSVGQAANQFYGHRTNGVYATTAEAQASKTFIKSSGGGLTAVGAGDVRFVNTFDSAEDIAENRHVIDENDRQVIGNPNPDVFGSLTSRLGYKRFSVNALFTFSLGNDVYNGTRAILESVSSSMNQTVNVLNRWTYEGQVTDVPKASFNDPMGNSRFSDRWIEDGSYLRLRNLSVAYSLPIKPGFLKNATAYATGNNLFTVSRYLGYDPEFSASGSPLGQGVDVALEPQFRSVQLGIRVGL